MRRCHSHKFDPISHKEFYQFYAFFNNVPERGLDGRTGNAVPVLPLPSPDQQVKLDDLDAAIKARQQALADSVVAPLQTEWEKTLPAAAGETSGLTAHYELDGSFSDISGRYQHGRTVRGDPTFEAGKIGRAASFDGDTEVSFGKVGGFDRGDAFSVAAWIRGRGKLPMAILQKTDPSDSRGYELGFDDVVLSGVQRWSARLTMSLASGASEGGIQIRTRERVTLGDQHHVTVTYDGSGKAAGLRFHIDGKPADVDVLRDALSGSIATDEPLRVGSKTLGKPFNGSIDDLRFYNRALTREEVEQLAIHYPVRAIVSGVLGRRSNADAAAVRDYFLTYAAPDALRTANVELKSLRAEKQDLEQTIPTAMVMAEMKPQRDTFVLARGDYRNQTEKVQPGVPAMLPPLPRDAPPNRLTLARWLVDPGHPLTSRVAVNRFWQMYFGYGIVKTQEDFGVQGESAGPSRAARLARDGVRADEVGHPRDAAADRDVGDVSTGVGRRPGAAREGSGESPACARAALPAARRDDPRHGARGQRPAEWRDRRTERVAVPAEGAVGGDGVRRGLLGADRTNRATARTSTGAACTRSGSGRSRRRRSPRSMRPIGRSAPSAGR